MNDVREKIKARVRKLLNLAGDAGAFDGEIDAAMNAAEQLMTQYQLDRAECEAAEVKQGHSPVTMGKSTAATYGASMSTWESTLAVAVSSLVGTVKHFSKREERKSGVFAAKKWGAVVVFYGPEDDSRLASELFEEWSGAIATIAVGKYKGCFRGDGGSYAMGFASALCDKAKANARERARLTTPSTTALVLVGSDRSLAALQQQTREQAARWLSTSCGIKLVTTIRRGGYSGSSSAYSEGRNDGAAANFEAKRTALLK